MAQIIEGTWEEIAARAEELRGKTIARDGFGNSESARNRSGKTGAFATSATTVVGNN